MTTVAQLTIEMAANVARLQQDMAKATSTVDGAMSKIQKSADVAMRAIGAIGLGISAAGLVNWVRQGIDAADATSKLAQKTGLLTQQVAGLQLAFDQGGAGDKMQATMVRLAKEAAGGNEAFKSMGIAVAGSSGQLKTTRELLAEVATKFAGYRDGAAKTALAQELFGKSGADIIPILNAGAGALDEYDKKAQALGLTLSDETTKAAEQFNDELDLVLQRSQGVARQMATDLLPVLTAVSSAMASSAQQGGAFSAVGAGLSNVIETLVVVGSNLSFVFTTLARDGQAIYNLYANILTLDIDGARAGIASYKAETIAARTELDAFQQRVLSARKDAALAKENSAYDQHLFRRSMVAVEAAKQEAPIIDRTVVARKASTQASKAEAEALRARIAAAQSNNAAFDAEFDALEKTREAVESRIQAARLMSEEIQRETELLGLSSVEREKAIALYNLERAGVVKGTEAYARYADEILRGIQARGDKQAGIDTAQKEAEAYKKALEDQAAETRKFWDSVDQTAHDVFVNVADEGVDAFKRIGKTLKAALLDMLYQMTVKKWIIQISGQGTAGAAGSGTNWIDMAAKAYDAYTGGSTASAAGSIANGMTQSQMLSAQTAGMGTTAATTSTAAAGTSGAATTAAAGTGTASAGAAAGGASTATAVAGYAAWIYAAYQLADSFYERGYNKEAVKDSAVYNASGEKGLYQMMKALGMSEKMATIWSGTTRMATLFGRRLKEAGMQGQFDGSGGIDVANYQYYKGGVFRSNKRLTSEMSDGRADSFETQLRNTQASAAAMARAMGASSAAVEAWVGKININLKGLSDSEAAAKVAEELDKLRGRMIEAVPEIGMSSEMFIKHLADVNAAIDSVGMGAGTIADVITQGMLGRLSTAQVGEQLSDIIIGGIYNSIAGGFAAQISNVFTQQIIQPVMTAVLAGVPISAAISQQAINTVVATAQGAAAQLSAIISDPAFRAAMSSIQSAISSVATISTSSARHVRSYGSAASASALAAKQAADEQRRAAQAIKDAWSGITDSILEEMNRIRRLILGETAAGGAYAQAQFTIATAQARAGNQSAAQRLPELSQALLDLAESTAASAGDLRAVQGATLASLAETRRILGARYGINLPAFAVGTNYVPQDMLAMVHKGEEIVPAAYNPAAGGTGANADLLADLVAETRALRATQERQSAISTAIAGSVARLERTMESVTSGGNVTKVQVVA